MLEVSHVVSFLSYVLARRLVNYVVLGLCTEYRVPVLTPRLRPSAGLISLGSLNDRAPRRQNTSIRAGTAGLFLVQENDSQSTKLLQLARSLPRKELDSSCCIAFSLNTILNFVVVLVPSNHDK